MLLVASEVHRKRGHIPADEFYARLEQGERARERREEAFDKRFGYDEDGIDAPVIRADNASRYEARPFAPVCALLWGQLDSLITEITEITEISETVCPRFSGTRFLTLKRA